MKKVEREKVGKKKKQVRGLTRNGIMKKEKNREKKRRKRLNPYK